MILTHWSPVPFTLDRTREYDQSEFGNGKPRGLWLSDETGDPGWKEWCQSEEWGLGALEHSTEFETVESSGLLMLASPADLRAFTESYAMRLQPALARHWIDWERVAAKYRGIVITPYQWSARLDLNSMWYYSWDVASACVWNLDAIREVRCSASSTSTPSDAESPNAGSGTAQQTSEAEPATGRTGGGAE